MQKQHPEGLSLGTDPLNHEEKTKMFVFALKFKG